MATLKIIHIRSSIRISILMIFAVLLFFPQNAHADNVEPDFVSLRAMMANHRLESAAIVARSIEESGVSNEHEESKKAVQECREMSDSLDKYDRAFDKLSLIFKGTSVGIHSIVVISETMDIWKAYLGLIKDYADLVAKNPVRNIYSSDTILINTFYETGKSVVEQVKDLEKSYYDIASYITGAKHCSMYDLLTALDQINYELDRLHNTIWNAYSKLNVYMICRRGYWKDAVFSAMHLSDDAPACLSAWVQAATHVANDIRANKRTDVDGRNLEGTGGLIGN